MATRQLPSGVTKLGLAMNIGQASNGYAPAASHVSNHRCCWETWETTYTHVAATKPDDAGMMLDDLDLFVANTPGWKFHKKRYKAATLPTG